ncbi:DWNN domain-containing protein [Baffinella frigidus]|nr:DWNN domain-containing protein [Cryptophyta sp. CCMP2293]
MASSVVHFKFRSALLHDTVNFTGDHISLSDLKRAIAKKKGLLKAIDVDFHISNEQTGEEYTSEEVFIPKNTSVVVKKINAKAQLDALRPNVERKGPKLIVPNIQNPESDQPADEAVGPSTSLEEEEAALHAMMNEQNAEWQRTTQQRRQQHQHQPQQQSKFGPTTAAKPPPYYICKRCEQTGHFVKDCPTLGDTQFDQKKYSVGIPTSQTRVISEAEAATMGEGVMRLPDGRLVLCEPSVYVPEPSFPCVDRGRFATVKLLKGTGLNTRGAVSFWAALCDFPACVVSSPRAVQPSVTSCFLRRAVLRCRTGPTHPHVRVPTHPQLLVFFITLDTGPR